jgi:hypothetical protein
VWDGQLRNFELFGTEEWLKFQRHVMETAGIKRWPLGFLAMVLYRVWLFLTQDNGFTWGAAGFHANQV